MSTGPRVQTDLIQGNKSKVEQNSPQCALFYLFQEVSKLASPVHSSFPDSNLPTEWPSETFSKDSLVIKKQEDPHLFETSISSTQDTLEIKKKEDSHSFHTCYHSCHDSLSLLMPCDELKKVSEECQSSKVAATLEPLSECNSPWKVLSLINLQCEKLLHQENPEELDPSSASSATKLGYSVAKSSTAAPHVIETGFRSGECMLGRSSRLFERQEITPSDKEEAPPAAPIKSCASKAEIWTVQNEEIGSSSSQQWRTKTPRKQPHPSRSADIQDPDFQGVTFRIDTELDESREQCRLLITSKYSKEFCKSVRKPRLRTRSSLKASSSDEENSLTNNVLKGKVCASCCTRKTPMWRDAEDGTPLCNACGIRYKKYRVRCVNCWHIPRKEGNSSSCCLKCGNFVSGWPHMG
uniref:Zinc finger GATA like protein 1 n=1 Tax=Amphilophus citrinellus TaxID=61819 RepID=A0A3Q0QXE3_AMPCI